MSFRVSLTLDLFLPQSSIGYLEIFREEKLSSEIHLPLSLLFPNVSASSLPFSFSSGVGGWVGSPPPSRPLSSTRAPEPYPAPRTAPRR